MSTQRNTAIAIILALSAVLLFVVLGFFGVSASAPSVELSGPQAILDELQQTGAVAGLRTYDITVGDGAEAARGDMLTVDYIGVLPDGTVFDSSRERGKPFAFELGAGQVIAGWEEGLRGMKAGGRRLIAIPPVLGYGANAVGSIPPNSTLIFDVELLGISRAEQNIEN